ncbi:DUF397 domain-containing protein [Actinomadura sp. KC06]|nr:DUF397 domain-containing protein [Actinomadura sp. KC06]
MGNPRPYSTHTIAIRDSKAADSGRITLTPRAFAAWLSGGNPVDLRRFDRARSVNACATPSS